MILECLDKLLHRRDLTAGEAAFVMREILSGEASPTQTAAVLIALAVKGETEDELLGMVRELRGKAYLFNQYGPVEVGLSNTERRMLLPSQVAGSTGATGSEATEPGATFNIASAVAFVVAGAGIKVLQQGHRTLGSGLESAAVLELLGIETRLPSWKIARCVGEAGLGFVFEPVISEAMEHLLFAFREIPIPTAFNLLLPMLNPGNAPALVLGVHSAAITKTVAAVLANLGVRRAFVVHGSDGLDEITNTGSTLIAEVGDGSVRTMDIEPNNAGLPPGRLEDLAGGDARRSAEIIISVLKGEQGPRRNVVLMNAAPGIVCGGKARNLPEAVQVAAESIDSGRAWGVLQRVVALTSRQ